MRRTAALLLSPLLAVGLLAGCGGSDSTADKGLPDVSGGYGDKPKVTADKKEKPGKKLKSDVLVRGQGPEGRQG